MVTRSLPVNSGLAVECLNFNLKPITSTSARDKAVRTPANIWVIAVCSAMEGKPSVNDEYSAALIFG